MNGHRSMMRRIAAILLIAAFGLPISSAHAQFTRVTSSGGITRTPTLADTLWLRGRKDAAFRELAHEITASDTVTSAQLYNRGLAARITGEGSGYEWFKKAYDADSGTYLNPWAVGVALTDEGQLVQGEQYLLRAVKLDKEYYESSVDLGRNLRLQKRYEEAAQAIRKAFGRDRTYAPAYTELARVHEDTGNLEQARKVLLEGYRRFPYEEITWELIRVERKLKRDKQVAEYAKAYLEAYPKGPHRSEVIEALALAEPYSSYTWPETYRHTLYNNGTPYAAPDSVLPLNIQLDYNVRWGLIRVGHLQIDVVPGTLKGDSVWVARYAATSAPGLPFITIADTFFAWIDKDLRFVPRLEMHYHEMGYEAVKTYLADYDRGLYEECTRLGDGYWQHTTHPLPPAVFDPSSQLWFAQQLVLARLSGAATVELSGGFEKTIINNRGVDDPMDIDGEDIPTIKLDGILRYAGIAGMTGDFLGWYTSDRRAWPVRAKFKIFLGWATIDYQSHQPSLLSPDCGLYK